MAADIKRAISYCDRILEEQISSSISDYLNDAKNELLRDSPNINKARDILMKLGPMLVDSRPDLSMHIADAIASLD